MRNLLVACLLLLGATQLRAEDYKKVNFHTLRSSVAIIDTFVYDDAPTNVAAVTSGSILDNQVLHKTAAISLKFSNAAATCVVHVVRGHFNGTTFLPFDVLPAVTFTAPSSGKMRGLYVAPTQTFDTAGFTGLMLVFEAPSAGTVDADGGVF